MSRGLAIPLLKMAANTKGKPMKRYLITWTEVSKHEVEVTAEELTDLKGIALSELDETDLEDGLADDLANLDDDGFQGLERHDIEVSEL